MRLSQDAQVVNVIVIEKPVRRLVLNCTLPAA